VQLKERAYGTEARVRHREMWALTLMMGLELVEIWLRHASLTSNLRE
jgi:hypothetical protein